MTTHTGRCHCGAIRVTLETTRAPADQILGACQCSFCRKHNARTFSDPKAAVTIEVAEPGQLGRYAFGLKTAEQIICRRCGVYVAMVLADETGAWSVLNIDTLDDRAAFTRAAEPRHYDGETREARITRRKARWTPTVCIGFKA